MEFRVLGPVEVLQDGHELPLGGPKQRALLALLLLDANKPVSRDRLIDGLWGERPPPSARHTLDTSVSRMRKTLGEGRLVTRKPGYLLRVEPGELDLERFEYLYRSGHEALVRGAADEAADALRSGLRLWSGPALANVLFESFGTSEAERLEERRLLALEDRIEADLELGRSDELIPELDVLVRDHPLRERVLGQLMLALYRSGRQAEALAALQVARHRFAEELGLEPGPHLRVLERQILQHDPALAASHARSSRDKRPRWPVTVTLGATAVATAAVVGVVLGIGQTTASRTSAQNRDTLVSVDANSGRIGPGIALPGRTTAMKVAGGSVWLADPNDDTISLVNAATATRCRPDSRRRRPRRPRSRRRVGLGGKHFRRCGTQDRSWEGGDHADDPPGGQSVRARLPERSPLGRRFGRRVVDPSRHRHRKEDAVRVARRPSFCRRPWRRCGLGR